MIRPNEAAGLTAALAKSVDRCAADLTQLLTDAAYLREIEKRGSWTGSAAPRLKFHRALHHLMEAERNLRELAGTLAGPPNCGHCGAAVIDAGAHVCRPAAAPEVQP